MVLGLTGLKFSGKDTLARYISKHRLEARTYSFASKLKLTCMEVWGEDLPEEGYVFDDPDLKEVKFEKPIHIDRKLKTLQKVLGVTLDQRSLVAQTPRQLMQYVGTEYVRSMHPTYWTDFLFHQIQKEQPSLHRFVIVSDVRFDNEGDLVRKFPDGKVVRVRRAGQQSPLDLHASEVEMAQIRVDGILEFEEGDFRSINQSAERLGLGPINWGAWNNGKGYSTPP